MALLVVGAVGVPLIGSATDAAAAGDPTTNLAYTGADTPLQNVDLGRAQDGVGPLSGSGLGTLTGPEELFVVVNLERIGRSLAPFDALTTSLDALAQQGANAGGDPPQPTVPGFGNEGVVEASGTADPLVADFYWMYDDGCTGPSVVNVTCSAATPEPWNHRNQILWPYSTGSDCSLDMGAAQATSALAAVFEGYCGSAAPTDVVFTWAQAESMLGLTPPSTTTTSTPTPTPWPVPVCAAPTYTLGYTFAASDGGVFNFGDYPMCGSMAGTALSAPIVGIALTPDKGGYWLAAADGGVFAFGDAAFYGSMAGSHLHAPIVGIAAAPFGNGYWLVAADGGVFAFGSPYFYGSMGGTSLHAPIVGMAVAPLGLGYWLVASDGGVFAFGSARFYGSMGAQPLARPIVGMAATPFGNGYWLAASDGGVFAFGSARFYGSMGAQHLARPIVGVAGAPLGLGYWLVGADGGVFAFGGAPFYGSTGAAALNGPIVGMAS
ncbi:MAG: hypothetical protein ABSG81_08615 [Acidimicrobiales bacterium]|jgi:hypothetical protein